ncbi:hypothetical protein ACKI1H_29070 [Pseudomonas sp. YH-1]|uniref:hypothetical protein n=1 Tax=Pseudomonas sp. YH-1 TaxID=3384787 RepID=UPI003F81BB6B
MKGSKRTLGHIVFFGVAILSTGGWLKGHPPPYVVFFGLPVLFFFWAWLYSVFFSD